MNPFEKQLWMIPTKLESALEEAAAKEGAIHVSDMQRLMQEASAAAVEEIKKRHALGAVDWAIPDATGLVCVAARPVPLSERRPDESEKNENGQCYYGHWDSDGTWEWVFVKYRPDWATHFLPAGVDVLPATRFNPEWYQ